MAVDLSPLAQSLGMRLVHIWYYLDIYTSSPQGPPGTSNQLHELITLTVTNVLSISQTLREVVIGNLERVNALNVSVAPPPSSSLQHGKDAQQ